MTDLDPGLDLFPLAAAILAATTCGVLGNFLVLQRRSLMGDAISHAVLPGLVVAFLLAGERSPIAMLLGAAAAGLITVVLSETVRRFGRVEPGAAMGVVFCGLFALGVLLLEQASVRQVDLDADCVLYGQLETLAWFGAPDTWVETFGWSTLLSTPRQVWLLAAVGFATMLFIACLYKELRLVSFDAPLAAALGLHPRMINLGLMVLVALATVASFEAVGSILVIAMLICPAAIARLLTNRFRTQLILSVAIAAIAAVVGYRSATLLPDLGGWESVNAAGMITVVLGVLLVLAIVAAPTEGVMARFWRRRRVRRVIGLEDLLATLWRAEESPTAALADASAGFDRDVVRRARRLGLITGTPSDPRLTAPGRRMAGGVVRRHRLWENFLVEQLGLSPDHVHDTAERLEHLDQVHLDGPDVDPHGRSIPSSNDDTPKSPGKSTNMNP